MVSEISDWIIYTNHTRLEQTSDQFDFNLAEISTVDLNLAVAMKVLVKGRASKVGWFTELELLATFSLTS